MKKGQLSCSLWLDVTVKIFSWINLSLNRSLLVPQSSKNAVLYYCKFSIPNISRWISLFRHSILRKKALWGISNSAKEGRWKVFFVDSHRSLTVLYRGGLYWRAISFESICVGSNLDLVVWVSRWYSGEKRAELIEMLILMEILIKILIRTCAHCPRFLCGTFFFFFLTWLNNPPIQDRTLRVSLKIKNTEERLPIKTILKHAP